MKKTKVNPYPHDPEMYLTFPEEGGKEYCRWMLDHASYRKGDCTEDTIAQYKASNRMCLLIEPLFYLSTIEKLNRLEQQGVPIVDVMLCKGTQNYNLVRRLRSAMSNGVLDTRIISYVESTLHLTNFFNVRNQIELAHSKCIKEINYVNDIGKMPCKESKNKKEKKSGRYFSGLYRKLNHPTTKLILDEFMLSKLKDNPIIWGYLTHAKRTLISWTEVCDSILYFIHINGRLPTEVANTLEERTLGVYLGRIVNYGHHQIECREYSKHHKHNYIFVDSRRLSSLKLRTDAIISKYPTLIDIFRYCRPRKDNDMDYRWLFGFSKRIKDLEDVNTINTKLSNHYGIENFLTYSYSALKKLVEEGKIK